jgi:hypothetical protein
MERKIFMKIMDKQNLEGVKPACGRQVRITIGVNLWMKSR